jgi:hypothetical protein
MMVWAWFIGTCCSAELIVRISYDGKLLQQSETEMSSRFTYGHVCQNSTQNRWTKHKTILKSTTLGETALLIKAPFFRLWKSKRTSGEYQISKYQPDRNTQETSKNALLSLEIRIGVESEWWWWWWWWWRLQCRLKVWWLLCFVLSRVLNHGIQKPRDSSRH